MKTIYLLGFLLVFSMSCSNDDGNPNLGNGCRKNLPGQGNIVSDTLSISSFQQLTLEIAADVIVNQGSELQVIATGHENVVDSINRAIHDNEWKINFDDDCFEDYELTIQVTLPSLSNVQILGAGDISIGDFQNQGNLDLQVLGVGDIEVGSFTGTETAVCNISGIGSISISKDFPDLKSLKISISGAGDFHGFPLSAKDCEVNVTGTGAAEVNATESLMISISGTGNIKYKGSPVIKSNIIGTGELINAN